MLIGWLIFIINFNVFVKPQHLGEGVLCPLSVPLVSILQTVRIKLELKQYFVTDSCRPHPKDDVRYIIFSVCPHLRGGGYLISQVWTRGGGTPSQVWMGGGTPSQVWMERGYPSQVQRGTPSQVWMVGYPIPGPDGRYPILLGVPIQDQDRRVPQSTPHQDLGWGSYPGVPPSKIQDLGGVPRGIPHPRLDGVSPVSRRGYPPHPRLDGVPP